MSYNRKERIVVSGLGVISSLGFSWQEFWKNIIAGKSGISQIAAFDTSKHDRQFAGEIKDFDPARFMDKRKAMKMGRGSQLAIAASSFALKDACFNLNGDKCKRIGVCIGTTMGEQQVMEKMNEQCIPHKMSFKYEALSAISYPAFSLANQVSLYFKMGRETVVFSNACASGNHAVARSLDLIRLGKADYMLAGGSDALSRIAFTGFSRMFAMAPEKCQPFDKSRKGMILGEGAGILFLETLESALKRNAHIYAEVLGYGLSCDAIHMTDPAADGVTKAVQKSLKHSDINPDDVDYFSAHGTGTKENDSTESKVIHNVFGKRAQEIPVSSIKSMLGHTMGAASALETIACCLAIDKGEIPPTINYETPDPECPVYCVPNKSIKRQVKVALNNSQAFGGNNAAVVLKKVI
ncbi:MAG: beta-ketoacyl-[acyl-carrier-protein] synthase family protein [Candidatus Omnitrophica bacterium]|nr:beta-ketoacyl-[acyl-carrier-protein] synthase family protein [Candidatus Omnitrophota bacterium]